MDRCNDACSCLFFVWFGLVWFFISLCLIFRFAANRLRILHDFSQERFFKGGMGVGRGGRGGAIGDGSRGEMDMP